MAVGQGVLPSAVLDVGEVRRLGDRVEERERQRSVAHAEQLMDLLALVRVYDDAGMGLGASAEAALLLGSSEARAEGLLADARLLSRLGALAVLREGLLTLEQARVVSEVLGPLDDVALAASLWEQLHARLLHDADTGGVLPPQRLREQLRRWLLRDDPDGAVARRKQAQRDHSGVQVWRRDDGLADIALRGLSGPNAQACLARISEHADPFHAGDDRSEGQRRLAAAVDLILGRIRLPFAAEPAAAPDGCGLGAQAPCGTQVYVHVPLPTALGASDEPAELVGHGPLDREQLQDLLLSAPVLHRVWVDAHGVPVAVDEQTWTPPRRDPDALRQTLLDMAAGPPPPPGQRHPVHPDDHEAAATTLPPGPRVLTRPHLADPGGYVPSRRLKRLVRVRSPRCEWPACGRRAIAPMPCDVDHDLPWPYGPTCACNTGPLCRRHHRIKQLGWTKHRQGDGSIRWTSPSRRRWTSAPPHPVTTFSRDIPPVPAADPWDALTPYEFDTLMAALDPEGHEAHSDPPDDIEPNDHGPMLRTTADLWTLIFDDSTWHDYPEPTDRDQPAATEVAR